MDLQLAPLVRGDRGSGLVPTDEIAGDLRGLLLRVVVGGGYR